MHKAIGQHLAGVHSGNLIGAIASETASIAYTGELLPTGTASYNTPIINTLFDDSVGWTVNAGWTVSGGKANVSNSGVASYLTFNSFSPTVGKQYEVSFTVSNYVAGVARFTCAGVNGQAITANGTYTETFVVLSAVQFSLYGGTTAVCSFDNITVKEVLINPNLRYLKNSGKDKTPALVESGQGKFFNGTNQYINTGIIPNQAQGTLVTRFTYVAGMVSRCIIGTVSSLIWVNASGKIEGMFGNVLVTSADVLVTGRSYHVALAWNGLTATLEVDTVTKASGTATAFNPTLPMAIGARLTAITPTFDRYFNNVIDETYYYDVALSDTQIQSLYLYPEKVKSYNGEIVPDIGSEANCKLFLPLCENSGSNVYNVAVNPATALALASYTTAMHTSAAKLSYGAQCTAWKRDSLGVLLGMSNGLSFDGGVSVNRVNTSWIPLSTENFVVESIVYSKSGLATNQNTGAKNLRWTVNSVGTSSSIYAGAWLTSTTAFTANAWHHLAIVRDGTTLTRYVDGILKDTWLATTWTSDTTTYFIGDDGFSGTPFRTITGTAKIHKGTQYAKFNIAKAWAKAQKTIAKLGA